MFVSLFVSVLCPLVLGLLCWCTARRLVSVFLFYVWCWVSLAGVLHIVLVLVVSCLLFGAGSPLLVYCTLFLCLSLFVLSCVCTVFVVV